MYSQNKMFDRERSNEDKHLRILTKWILVAFLSTSLFVATEGQEGGLCNSLTRFTCDDGICISKARLCDNFWDCAQGEDELYCDSTNTSCERDETIARMNKYKCRNRCESHADCGSRNRRCMCDDECGMSCISQEVPCRSEPPEVENSVGYEVQRRSEAKPAIVLTKRYHVGDVVKYQCKTGMKLIGPLPRCNGRGQWSREVPRCVVVEESTLGLFRVTGGERAARNSWPWQVLITEIGRTPEETLSRGKLHGGGSLLNEKWVLTAAHLFLSSNQLSSYVISIGVFKRPLGRERINKDIQMFTPSAIYSHREFSLTKFLNDIALVKIGARFDSSMSTLHSDTAGVVFGSNAREVILPCTIPDDEVWWVKEHESFLNIRDGQFAEECLMEEKRLIRKNLTSTVTGFGHMHKSKGVGRQTFDPPEYLQQASLTLGDIETCRTGIDDINRKKGTNLEYSEKIICTNRELADACRGDSGGPLVRKEIDWLSRKVKWIQIGIVSYGLGCGLNYPGFYTNVARYIQWIKETIESDNDKVQMADMDSKISVLSSSLEDMQYRFSEMKIENNEVKKALEETQEKLDQETRHLESKVTELEAKIQNMIQTIPAMCDGVIYDGRCYWAEVHSSDDTNNAEAQEICRNRGSRLADIYGQDHFNMVMKYLKSKLNGRSYIDVWTGMKKIYGNRSAQLSDNTQAPYTKARSWSWNTASRDRTHVYLVVRGSDTDSDQRMSAAPPSWNVHGALCQSQ